MQIRRPVAFPLLPIVDGKCGCGDPECGNAGKHPAVEYKDLKHGDPVPLPVDGAGAGLKCGAHPKGSDIIVVDLDGLEAQARWREIGGTIGDTLTVRTGRDGGLQLYFEHPGFRVYNSRSALAPKIDIRGDGGMVVAPGSPHRSGRTYELDVDLPPAPAPGFLVAWLKARAAPVAEAKSYAGDVTDPAERAHRKALFASHCKKAPPSIEGHGGDDALWAVVQRGAYDLALPTEDVLEVVREHFDPRCVPPWGEELEKKVRHKCGSAKTQSTRERSEPFPAELAHLLNGAAPPPSSAPPSTDGIVWGQWECPIEPPRYLVERLIPIDTVGMFVAMGSSLKTWTALSISTAVAKGEPWLGEYATRKGRALVVDYESGLYELRRRVHLLERGGRLVDLGAWPFPDARIDDPAFWNRLTEIEGLTLVTIDSLSAGAPGVDENDARASTPLKLAARFSEAVHACVLFIHHAKKDDSDDRKMMRGTTALYNDCDWAYKFESLEETDARRRMRMACIKPCMGPRPAPVSIELTDDGLTSFDARTLLTPHDATPEAIQQSIRLALQSAGNVETTAKLRELVRVNRNKLVAELEVLTVRGEVKKLPQVGYVLDSPAARKARVLSAVAARPNLMTEAQIAKAAHVDTDFVRNLVEVGTICRRSSDRDVGGFLVIE